MQDIAECKPGVIESFLFQLWRKIEEYLVKKKLVGTMRILIGNITLGIPLLPYHCVGYTSAFRTVIMFCNYNNSRYIFIVNLARAWAYHSQWLRARKLKNFSDRVLHGV